MTNAHAVGIDLGTTNSMVAYVDSSGRTAIIPNVEGDLITPSVVMFDDDEVIVGKEARRIHTVSPEKIAEWVKRDMGSPVYSRPIRGEYLPPEVIQACILRRLKADVTAKLGPAVEVVITVPAYFDEPRRKSTADAGEMAGFQVRDIVNEPTAAAMAFGEVHGYLTAEGEPRETITLLVYDLGGGTFDVTLLRLAPGDIHALATDGDVQLGGHDWDMRLVDHAAESFQAAHGQDPREDQAAFFRLYNRVLEAKHTLSVRGRATIQVDHADRSHRVEITRSRFEEMTADLLERTAYTTRQLLATSGLAWTDVSRLLLVGGSTRMPMVSQMLTELTGIRPDRSINPDEAVARGAALYASYLTARESGTGPGYQITNINAHSLGVEGIEPETLRKKNVVLIGRNTRLPARFTKKFTTKTENQPSIVVQVLEGENANPGECSAIGRMVIRDLPPGLPRGWPVEVTFEYAANGRLSVRAIVPGTDREMALDLEREGGLSGDCVQRWRAAVTESGGFSEFEALVDEILQTSSPLQRSASSKASPIAKARSPIVATQPVDQSDDVSHADLIAEPTIDNRPIDLPQVVESQPKQQIPAWLITVVGFVISSVVGIGLGYVIITKLFPEHGLPKLW